MTRLKAIFLQTCTLTLSLGVLATGLSSCKKSSNKDEDYVGNWFRSYDFEGVARTEAVSFVIGNNAYIGTGYKKDDERLNDFWAFDQTTATWYQKADMPVKGRNSAVAFSIGNKGYVGTGYDGLTYLKDFWEYDADNNTWGRKADFAGSGRYGATAFAVNGKGYITTGYDDNFLKDLWEYDPASNQWVQKASLAGTKRKDAVSFVIGNTAYVCTGLNNGAYPDDMWAYNAGTNVWTQKRRVINVSDEDYDDNYNIIRSNACTFVIDGLAYLTNGEHNGTTGTTWMYEPGSDTWKQKTSFEATTRIGAIGFSLNNRGYVTTGNNTSANFDDMWEFAPYAEKVAND